MLLVLVRATDAGVRSVPGRLPHSVPEVALNPSPALMEADQAIICCSWRGTSEPRRARPVIRKRVRESGPAFVLGGWGGPRMTAAVTVPTQSSRGALLSGSRSQELQTNSTSLLRCVTQSNCCSGDSARLLSEALTISSNSAQHGEMKEKKQGKSNKHFSVY